MRCVNEMTNLLVTVIAYTRSIRLKICAKTSHFIYAVSLSEPYLLACWLVENYECQRFIDKNVCISRCKRGDILRCVGQHLRHSFSEFCTRQIIIISRFLGVGAQQQTRRTSLLLPNDLTDGHMLDHFIQPAQYTMRAVPLLIF